MIKITLTGEPIAKMRPRITRKGAYDPQHSQKHACKFQVLSQINGRNPFSNDIAIEIEMNFYFHCPSNKMNLLHWGIMDHVEKPDVDNICKFYLDVLNKIIYEDDKQIIQCIGNKFYSEDPRTEIKIMPKKPECCDQVKELLSLLPPSEISSISDILSSITDWCDKSENPYHLTENCNFDYDEVAFLILEFAEKHADNLKKINKKFPGLAKILKERMENK